MIRDQPIAKIRVTESLTNRKQHRNSLSVLGAILVYSLDTCIFVFVCKQFFVERIAIANIA